MNDRDRTELLGTLHEADGYLSLVGYRYAYLLRTAMGHEEGQSLAEALKSASARCRRNAAAIEGKET